MFTINSFSLAKLNNAEFVGYCVNLGNLIERAEATKLGLEAGLMSEFTDVKQKLIDQVYNAQGSAFTAEMNASETKRDMLTRQLFLHLQIIIYAEPGSMMLQFKPRIQSQILTKYSTRILSMAQQEESAVLQGLIHDMRTIFTEDDLDDMHVATLLTNLEAANQEFIAAYANRVDELASAETGLTLKLRNKMLEVIQQIYNTVQYLANSTLEANASKTTACQAFVGALNVVLADAKKRWNQRTSGEVADGQGESTNSAGTGGNTGNTSGGNTQGGNNTPVIDHENGTEHDGTLEF